MEKVLWSQWNISVWFIASMVKVWIYERLFFEVVIVVVKEEKKYSIKDAMSIKFANFHQVDKNNVTSSFQGF